MTKRILLAAACIAWLAPAAPVSAQDRATVILRSGERASGDLIDHDARGFTILSNGQERSFPTLDVVSVEFTGAPALSNDLIAKLNQGQHVLWLRNSQAVVGTLVDITERGRRIHWQTESGQRSYVSGEVAAIYVAAPRGSTGTTGGTTGGQPSEPGAITVPGNQAWVPTGLTVRGGETLGFQANGEIVLSGDSNDKANVAGSVNQRRPTADAPLPDVLAGGLLGRINNGRPFPIGNQSTVTMPAGGQLFLGINDDFVGDNSGQFNVTITRRTPRRR